MDRLPLQLVDQRRALAGLPPLIKAYARAGSRFSTEAVVDHRFNTTDVFTILPFADADPRYLAHFGNAALGTSTDAHPATLRVSGADRAPVGSEAPGRVRGLVTHEKKGSDRSQSKAVLRTSSEGFSISGSTLLVEMHPYGMLEARYRVRRQTLGPDHFFRVVGPPAFFGGAPDLVIDGAARLSERLPLLVVPHRTRRGNRCRGLRGALLVSPCPDARPGDLAGFSGMPGWSDVGTSTDGMSEEPVPNDAARDPCWSAGSRPDRSGSENRRGCGTPPRRPRSAPRPRYPAAEASKPGCPRSR